MEHLDGFSALDPDLRATLVYMRASNADLSDYYTMVRNKSVEGQIIIFYYAFGKKKKAPDS